MTNPTDPAAPCGEPIQEWFNRQRESTPDEMFYKESSGSQIMFARDSLCGLVDAGLPYDRKRKTLTVISEHRSKSVALPVYNFERPDLGLRFVARNNFYNWKLSVISERPIECDFSGLFKTTAPIEPEYTGDPLHAVYFEGFPRELVFGYYEANKHAFSAEIGGDNAMWTALFLIMRSVGAIKPMAWHTKESHRAALDAESQLWKKKWEDEKLERAQ